jgi:hypothetical protein
MASGRTVMTPSALLDPRFRDRGSVQVGKIEAVLCVPIGGPPPVGVVYLQARATPGPYSPEEQANAELFDPPHDRRDRQVQRAPRGAPRGERSDRRLAQLRAGPLDRDPLAARAHLRGVDEVDGGLGTLASSHRS